MRKIFPLIAILVIAAWTISARAANMTFMTVTSTKQGQFKGEAANREQKGAIMVLGFAMEMDAPRDPASGMPTGRRVHKPVVITKDLDSSSPQFFQAAAGNETLKTVVIEFARSDPRGLETVYYKVTLTNANIASLKQFTADSASGRAGAPLEEISLTFQKIEVESVTGKTTAQDDWLSK